MGRGGHEAKGGKGGVGEKVGESESECRAAGVVGAGIMKREQLRAESV